MPNTVQLKRSLKLTMVTFYGVGAILGAGIYVLIGEVAAEAGYLSPLSFLLASIIALFSAFSYAELSARFPKSAGEAIYIDQAFGIKSLTQLIGLMVIFTGIVSAATMAVGVVGYFQLFFDWPPVAIICCFVLSIGLIAAWGIEESAWVVTIITLLEVGGLLFVIFVATDDIGSYPSISTQFELVDSSVVTGIFLGGFLAFYAYIGFEDMVNIAEEIQQPEKVLPRAIFLALAIATLIYMLVSIAALSVLSPTQLAASTAPLSDVVVSKGYPSIWIGIISLVAVINGAIVQMIMASRVVYGMASNELLPLALAKLSRYTKTPLRATLITVVITLVLALLFPLASLAQATSVIVLGVFALVNVALVRINRLKPDENAIHYPGWIPVVGAILCIGILVLKAIYIFLLN